MKSAFWRFARALALLLPPLRRLYEQRGSLALSLEEARARGKDLAAANAALSKERDVLGEALKELRGEREAIRREAQAAYAQAEKIGRELQAARTEAEQLRRDRDALAERGKRLEQALKEAKAFPFEKTPEPAQDAGEAPPSVFFVSLPKSGTVFTWYSLEGATGLRMPQFHELPGWPEYNQGLDFSSPAIYAAGDYNTQLLIPTSMKHYLKGFIFGAHMQASHHNIEVLKRSGIGRITVLLRDPRDAFISWVHHLGRLGASARDYHSKIYHIPRAYYGWPRERQFEYQIRTFLPITVNWVEGWLDYYAAPERDIDVLLVYYDELKTRPARYIRRIADFHGLQNVDYSKIVVPERGKYHFRRGEHEQWRDEFSAHDQGLVEDLMQGRLLDSFDRAACAHPGFARAQRELSNGQPQTAAVEALRAIDQFPNHRASYEVLARAAEAAGADARQFRAKLADTLERQTVSSLFLYRYELIDAARELAAPKTGATSAAR